MPNENVILFYARYRTRTSQTVKGSKVRKYRRNSCPFPFVVRVLFLMWLEIRRENVREILWC